LIEGSEKNMGNKNVQNFVSSIKRVVGEDVEIQVRLVDEMSKDRSGIAEDSLRKSISFEFIVIGLFFGTFRICCE
jgi:hypothetical protein